MSHTNKAVTPAVEGNKSKPTPTFLKEDFPYKAAGHEIIDLDALKPGTVYEIKCPDCEMRIRSQGQKLSATYERLKSSGCLSCGNKELVIRMVDMRNAPANKNTAENQ